MTPDGPLDDAPDVVEAAQLAQIEADLADLSANVNAWIAERFGATAAGEGVAPSELDVADVNGLIAWLGQWHIHFDRYGEMGERLGEVGHRAVSARLAAIDAEIDKSIENFTQLAESLPNPFEG